jgi:ComF family protein
VKDFSELTEQEIPVRRGVEGPVPGVGRGVPLLRRLVSLPRLRRAARAVLDLVLPPRCLLCAAAVERAGTLCAAPPPYDRARSVMIYDDHSRGLVLALKHGDRLHGVPAFGTWLRRAGGVLVKEADLIVPVPLHWSRLWRRRYNQSALLARALWQAVGLDGPAFAADLLVRRRRTPPQGRRTRSERARNVKGAFVLKRGAAVAGKRILVIDDVMTSGATVAECARVLRRAGAIGVDVLTLARAVRIES